VTLSLAAVRDGGKAAVARALTAIEERAQTPEIIALLDAAYAEPRAHVIGITGPPGAGKSTLIDAGLRHWRAAGLTVAVLAVDPSSRASRGALLGDRVRMRTAPDDAGVFIRSLAARDRLGGLADVAFPATILMRAIYDRVIVESVGVGQSETDIAAVADTVVLCVQPGSGDSLQFMKAGIVEIPDIAVVTKGDMGAVASRALADLNGALQLGLRDGSAWQTACLLVSSAANTGLSEFMDNLAAHRRWLDAENRLAAQRDTQVRAWMESEVLIRFGKAGTAAAAPLLARASLVAPFHSVFDIMSRLRIEVRA
jgi:LAO/AO transport system kinase